MNGSWPGTLRAQWYSEHTQLILIPQAQSTFTITGFMYIIWFSEQNTTFQKKSPFAFSGEKVTKHLLQWILQKELHLITGPLCLLFCSTWYDGHSSLTDTSINLRPSNKKKKRKRKKYHCMKMCNMFAIQQPNSSFNQSWVWFRFLRKAAQN